MGFTHSTPLTVKGGALETLKRQVAVICDWERTLWLLEGEWGCHREDREPLRSARVPKKRPGL